MKTKNISNKSFENVSEWFLRKQISDYLNKTNKKELNDELKVLLNTLVFNYKRAPFKKKSALKTTTKEYKVSYTFEDDNKLVFRMLKSTQTRCYRRVRRLSIKLK